MVNTTPKKSHTTHLWMCLFVHHSFLQTLHSPHVSPSAIERTPVSRNAGRDQAHDAESQTGNGADCNLALEWPFGWGIFTCLPKICWKCVWYSQTQWTLQRFWFVFFAGFWIGFWSHVVLPCFDMFRPPFFVHLIVPDFTATLCDPFEGQNFKTSLSLRVEVRVHFECHGGYGICHWDWDPAWRKWISYSKNWFGRICSPCFLLFTTILFLISTFIVMEYIPWRIHGAAIYGNMDPINMSPMLAYIPAPWILWVLESVIQTMNTSGVLRCSPVKKSLLNSR